MRYSHSSTGFCVGSVSYTHLDVYKRQFIANLVGLLRCHFAGRERLPDLKKQGSTLYGPDVYKRQDEFYLTGTLHLNMPKHGTKYPISEANEKLIDLFLDYTGYCPNTRDDVVWVVRRYLHYFESLGYASLEWVPKFFQICLPNLGALCSFIVIHI